MSEKNVSNTKWMKRAIFLASLGKNTTSPNPRVGAVILDKNGNLIAEGFHFKAGMPHAEAMAINNLKKDAKGGTGNSEKTPAKDNLNGLFLSIF